MNIVLDASAVAAWVLPSQHTASAQALLDEAGEHRFFAPHIFAVEVRAFLLAAERRDGFHIADTEKALTALDNMDLTIVDLGHSIELSTAMGVARAERLSMYDGLYLYLALSDHASLASRDKALLDACERRSVHRIDLRL